MKSLSTQKNIPRSEVFKIIFLIFILGLLIGGLLNENKQDSYKKKKQEIANKLNECDVLGASATKMGQQIKDMEMEEESMQDFYDFLGLSREYFLCIQDAYDFEERYKDEH